MPKVFAVGPPRTATTWMHRVLAGRVNLPRIKETRFFDRRYLKGFDWYRRHFIPLVEGLPIAEIAPTYFYSGPARQRIFKTIPEAKVIITLRDPVERLYSLYKLKVSDGTIRMPFERAVRRHPELIESNRYYVHVSGWISQFGNERVLVMLHDELVKNPQAYLARVCEFIGVSCFAIPESLQQRRSNSSNDSRSPTSAWLSALAVRAAESFQANNYKRTLAAIRKIGLRRLVLKDKPIALPPLDADLAEALRVEMNQELESLEVLLGSDLSMWKAKRLTLHGGTHADRSVGSTLELAP
ncbi:MAG: sulfotransferase [Candidatus Binataceae bacterium]|nr:sulfotransferase [Candidatus Binataceae bacterium]